MCIHHASPLYVCQMLGRCCFIQNNTGRPTWIPVHDSLLLRATCKVLNRLGTGHYARWCGRETSNHPIRLWSDCLIDTNPIPVNPAAIWRDGIGKPLPVIVQIVPFSVNLIPARLHGPVRA